MPDPQRIDIPGVGIVEFPASMSDVDVSAAAKRLHDEANYRPDPTMQAAAARAMARNAGMLGLSDVQHEQHEPDTFMGGFTKSLKDQILGATVGNPQLQGAAYPSTVGDITSILLAPTDVTRSGVANLFRGPTGIVAVAKEAGATSPTLKQIPKTVAKILTRNAFETAPTAERSGMGAIVDRYAPNVSAGAQDAIGASPSSPLPQVQQAVKVQLPDGTWGLKSAVPGQMLAEGQPANVTLRSGVQRIETVPVAVDPAADVRAAKMLIHSGQSAVQAATKASEGNSARFIQIMKSLGQGR